MSERERFEVWAKLRGYNTARQERKPDDYQVLQITMLWDAWQASRREALEEAAGVAYAHSAIMATTTAQLIENAIRALAGSTEAR